MDRTKAVQVTKELLDKHGLTDYKVRITTDSRANFAGKHYEFPYKMIVLNGLMIDAQPEPEIMNTIWHEVAHAIVGNKEGHNEIWAAKAKELGCLSTGGCAPVPPHILDAIRAGHLVEIDYEIVKEKRVQITEEDVIKPKYTVTRLQDLCPICGKVAKEKFSFDKINPVDGELYRWITYDCFHVFKKRIDTGTKYDQLVSNGWKPEIKACKHKWGTGKGDDFPDNQCTKCGEFKFYDFQVKTGHFLDAALSTHKGGLVANDCGLGKTANAVGYVFFHPQSWPVLYAVKSKTKFQWLKSLLTWGGPEFLGQIIETGRDPVLPGLRSYIISYDLMRRMDRSKLQAIGFKLVVLDECQQIKNVDSTRTQEVRKILADPNMKVIAMSATPWKNRGEELYPVLNMIAPTKFPSPEGFKKQWVDFYMHGNQTKQGGIKNIPKFKEYTKDIIIRFEFDEVFGDKAPVTRRMKLPVQLDEIAQEGYDDATSDFVDWYNQHLIDGTEDKIGGIEILAQMARMRHITGLAKVAATVEFCDEFYESTDRSLVIFVHHKDVGYHIVEELKKLFADKKDVVIETLTAAKKDIGNNAVASKFNTDGKRWFIVASTLACGEGIDGLQKGWDSVLHERQWNPQNEDQATPGRLKRIGQKSRVVNITCVEADETIDQDLDEIVERKRRQFHAVHGKSTLETWNTDDAARELANKIVQRWKKKGKKVKNKNIKQLATVNKQAPMQQLAAEMFAGEW